MSNERQTTPATQVPGQFTLGELCLALVFAACGMGLVVACGRAGELQIPASPVHVTYIAALAWWCGAVVAAAFALRASICQPWLALGLLAAVATVGILQLPLMLENIPTPGECLIPPPDPPWWLPTEAGWLSLLVLGTLAALADWGTQAPRTQDPLRVTGREAR